MLVVRTVGPGVVPYFLDGRSEGRWSTAAVRLLGVGDPVRPGDLRRVLDGRHPGDSRFLPARRPAHRRGGWDLVFGAPKSLSLLATAAAGAEATVRSAHETAVRSVLGHVEDRLLAARGYSAGQPLKAEGLIAASFQHLENSAARPHLHTHVLVANLAYAAGAWGALKGDEWFVGRQALAALYQLELRHQLREQGWHLDWRLRPDGLADLADVPRSVVRAHSTYERAPAASPPSRPAPRPELHLAPGGSQPVLPPPDPEDRLAATVALRLTTRRSDFRAADAVVALASCHAGGATVTEATTWVERFCAGCPPVPSPTSGPRWTTPAAQRTDQELLDRLLAAAPPGPVPDPVDAVTALASAEGGVYILGAQPGRCDLLAQAEVLATCGTGWAAAGRRAAVSSPTPLAAERWRVLTGIDPLRPGDRPDVLVVDQADRRTTTELSRLLARAPGTVVLVEGGALPRLSNPASHALAAAGDRLGRLTGPTPPPWRLAPSGSPLSDLAPSPGPEACGRAAAEALLRRWDADGGRAVLVGLGLEEVKALNQAVLGAPRPPGPGRFRPGDPVVVLKGAAGLPAYGTFGTVASTGKEVGITWAGGRATRTSDHRVLARVGFGYAVTPHLAGRDGRALMVLGPASALDRGRGLVVAEMERGPDGTGRDRGAARSIARSIAG